LAQVQLFAPNANHLSRLLVRQDGAAAARICRDLLGMWSTHAGIRCHGTVVIS
jgi:hypothetical protein